MNPQREFVAAVPTAVVFWLIRSDRHSTSWHKVWGPGIDKPRPGIDLQRFKKSPTQLELQLPGFQVFWSFPMGYKPSFVHSCSIFLGLFQVSHAILAVPRRCCPELPKVSEVGAGWPHPSPALCATASRWCRRRIGVVGSHTSYVFNHFSHLFFWLKVKLVASFTCSFWLGALVFSGGFIFSSFSTHVSTRPFFSCHQSGQATPRLNRCELYVPGTQAKIIPKAAKSAADVVVMDLEDSVAIGEKEVPAAMAMAVTPRILVLASCRLRRKMAVNPSGKRSKLCS